MPTTQERLDELAQSTANGLHAGERALDRLSDSANEWRQRAGDVASQGAQWVRDSGDQVRTQLARASDRTIGYVRDEPVRAVLIAVAAGAVLVAIARIFSGRTSR